ncbi:hypothetical protein HNO88_000137 [Novosphingobium chloroacetimidivorans]|uniref:Uncharacterized protein n=1 Tax=Novosphingobium chloroacetimidivorans TaxID=1428314 RepID=A0A7W7K5X5_9SPHN|nr:hypothetical protein [Novosphingobium chloroacetimidivorans]MBB4856840.1 hypothetical protein [Novosphingobium chloroacetimidivorans]
MQLGSNGKAAVITGATANIGLVNEDGLTRRQRPTFVSKPIAASKEPSGRLPGASPRASFIAGQIDPFDDAALL